MTAPRRFRYWTEEEDRALLAFRAGYDKTLRQLAEELGRTFAAARHRRKALLARRLRPGQRYLCRGCTEMLPPGQKHGFCAACRDRKRKQRYSTRYALERRATRPGADRKGMRWTPDEDRAVLSAYPDVEMARHLKRTLASCRSRRDKLLRQGQQNGHDTAA